MWIADPRVIESLEQNEHGHVIASEAKQSPTREIEIASSLCSSQ